MNDRVRSILADCTLAPGATEESIAGLTSTLGLRLPQDYLALLAYSNGIEGFVGEFSYIMLWPVERIIEANAEYEVGELAPGLLLFGTDGSLDGYGFDTRITPTPYISLPLISMKLDEVAIHGYSLEEFLSNIIDRWK